jgi:hypothetical protein
LRRPATCLLIEWAAVERMVPVLVRERLFIDWVAWQAAGAGARMAPVAVSVQKGLVVSYRRKGKEVSCRAPVLQATRRVMKRRWGVSGVRALVMGMLQGWVWGSALARKAESRGFRSIIAVFAKSPSEVRRRWEGIQPSQ